MATGPKGRGRKPQPAQDESLWEHRLKELLDFRRSRGHVHVPRSWSSNPKLANWVNNQRRLLQQGQLGERRLRRLQQFGIAWPGAAARRNSQQATWDRMYAALRTFKRSTGHLDVPRGWTPEPSLSSWMASQRYLWRHGSLPPARAKRLSELDLEWHRVRPRQRRAIPRQASPDRRALAWERRFEALRDFHQIHGHCAVPARWAPDRRLADWVVSQRTLLRLGRLGPERHQRLDALGFVWSGVDLVQSRRARRWEERFAALAEFAATRGHCNVPRDGATGLAAWVFRQRVERHQGRLHSDRIRKLDGLKFDWKPRRSRR